MNNSLKINILALCIALIVPVFAWSAPPFVPFPEGVKISVVGEDIVVNGLPVMAYEYYSNDSIDDVLNFYRTSWEKKKTVDESNKHYLETDLGQWKVISRIEKGHNITVQLMSVGIRGVRALVGISPLPKYLKKGRKNTTLHHVPELGLSKVISQVVSNDNGIKSETYWMESGDSVDVVLARYNRHYRGQGYEVNSKRVLKENSTATKTGFIEARQANEKIRLESVDVEGKTRIVATRREF